MSTPNTPLQVAPAQQKAITSYVRNCVEAMSNTWNLRSQFLFRDQIYQREIDYSIENSRARQANLTGDPYKFQNLTPPIVMPQVESALAYLGGVFLTGYPIFGVAADVSREDKALQMETVIADNSNYYGWPRELIMYMRDGLKYNLGAVEVEWKKKKIYSMVDDPVTRTKKTEKYYEGNSLKRLDPYNLIWDKRVWQPARCHIDGEFMGYTEIMTRIQLKQLLLDLGAENTMNARDAFQSGNATIALNGQDSWYYIPQVNPQSFLGSQMLPTTNWMAWAMLEGSANTIEYNNMYEVTTLYGRVIPNDFRLAVPQRNQPQIYKFIVVNRNTLIYCERKSNAHNYLPILLCQPTEDGLGYQTKSFLDNAAPFQFFNASIWSATTEGLRRDIFDRLLYDPSRIRKEDIDRAQSVARIPVKQSVYGKPVGDAVYHFPYDATNISRNMEMSQIVSQMADEANGQNKVQRGQFQKGNKTRTEFVDTMSNANSRQQLQAIMFEHQVFMPMKEMVKLNILQYQPDTEYYNIAQKSAVKIKGTDLRAMAQPFKISDGLLPTDKLMNTDLLSVFLQTIQTSPLMQAEFDTIGAYSYWMKLQGANWFEDFKRSPEQAQQQLKNWVTAQQAGAQKPAAARPQNAAEPSQTQQ